MTQYAIVTDLNRCVGCLACAVACKVANNVPIGSFWNKVLRIGPNPSTEGSDFPNVDMYFLPIQCQHCENPACVANCPTGAMAKREDNGAVVVDQDVCIGCGTCVNSCPYEVPQIDEEAGVSSKCTLCFDRLDNDHRPWCVQACPAEARIVGDLNDPESEVSKYIAEKGAVPYLEENGTTPSVYYV